MKLNGLGGDRHDHYAATYGLTRTRCIMYACHIYVNRNRGSVRVNQTTRFSRLRSQNYFFNQIGKLQLTIRYMLFYTSSLDAVEAVAIGPAPRHQLFWGASLRRIISVCGSHPFRIGVPLYIRTFSTFNFIPHSYISHIGYDFRLRKNIIWLFDLIDYKVI